MVGLEDVDGCRDAEQNREEDGRWERWTVRPVVVWIVERWPELVEGTSHRAEKHTKAFCHFGIF